MDKEANKNKSNNIQIGLAAGSHFIIDIYQGLYIGLIPFLVNKFGLSLFEVSLLAATSITANSLFSPIFGYLSDRYKLKYFITAGLLTSSVFLSIIGIINNYWIILIFIFLGNLGVAAFHPANAAMAGHYGGKRKGFSTSLINFGGNAGAALGSLLIILILKKIGISYTPLIIIAGIITVIILLKFLPSKQHAAGANLGPRLITRLKKIKGSKVFLISCLIFSVYSLYIIWVSLVTYMPVYFTELNIDLITIGIILFLYGTLAGGGGFVSGFIFDKTKKGSYIIQTAMFFSIPLIYLIFQTNGFLTIVFFILSGLFLISIQPVCIRMSQDLFPQNMSLASSLILGLSSGLAGITMVFLGKAADKIGIANLVRLELILLAVSFVLLFAYPIVEKKLKN